jgi:hypothetical protein
MRQLGRAIRWLFVLMVLDYAYHAARNAGWSGRIHLNLAAVNWSALKPLGVAALIAFAIWALWPRPYKLGKGWPSWHQLPRDPVDLLDLSPAQFEATIAQLLHSMGYHNVRSIGGPGDLGVDVECLDANGQRVIAQCKRYASDHPVGSPELQSFIGMAYTHHEVAPGCALYFTTSRFTRPALDLGRQHRIMMVDNHRLSQLLASL